MKKCPEFPENSIVFWLNDHRIECRRMILRHDVARRVLLPEPDVPRMVMM